MDTIIARQDVARRRRPYAPIASAGAKSHTFLEIPGQSVKKPQHRGPRGTGASMGPAKPSSIYFHQDVRPHKAKREGPSPILHGLSSFGTALSASIAGMGRGVSRFLAASPARIEGIFFRSEQRESAAAMEFVPGLGAADGGFADRAGLEGLSGLRPARKETAKRGLPPWLWRAGAATLALGALLLLALVLGNRSLRVPAEGFLPAASTADDPAADLLLAYLSPELEESPDEESIKAVPLPRALELSSYTVRPGDSIGAIAKRFGRSADSILSINGIKSVKALKSGAVLKIPNMDGILHVVARGESLGKIAKDSKVEVTAIVDANDLGSSTLRVGQAIFIPGARLSSPELRRIYGTTVVWPVRGPISSYFGIRSDPFTGVRRLHSGIDIAVDLGTPVKAAMDGRVADLGYNANYGNYIIMNNGDGIQTLYGHLSGFCVTAGQSVAAGAVIAKSGNTGYSTGPHLHFGVYRGGAVTNPLKMLK